MSFIDTYLNKYRLDEIPKKIKNKLDTLEQEMTNNAQNADFGECIKQFGPQIADLVERLSIKLHNVTISSFSDAIDLFRFAKTIGFEVYQIIKDLSGCTIPTDLSADEENKAKIELGVNLTYFVWLIVDPFKNKFNGIPFKKWIEQKLVRWLARMSIEFTIDYLKVNESHIKVLKVDTHIRAI